MQHVAFNVDTHEELMAIRDRIRSKGVNVIGHIDHGMCESIYFAGPEGLTLEVATSSEALNPEAWIDPEVVALAGITAEELERFKRPAPYAGEGGHGAAAADGPVQAAPQLSAEAVRAGARAVGRGDHRAEQLRRAAGARLAGRLSVSDAPGTPPGASASRTCWCTARTPRSATRTAAAGTSSVSTATSSARSTPGRSGCSIFMHPTGGGMYLPIVPGLAAAGHHVIWANSRYRGTDSALIMEKVVADLGQVVKDAKERLGYEQVVLAGWSGGGSLSAYYQAVANAGLGIATPRRAIRTSWRPSTCRPPTP